MSICYGVSSGSYSDYGVSAIFSTREKAEAWLARHGIVITEDAYDYYQIEEFSFDEAPTETHGGYKVELYPNGEVYTRHYSDDIDIRTPATIQKGRFNYGGDAYIGYGRTEEHARRSAEEYRRACLAGTIVHEPPTQE